MHEQPLAFFHIQRRILAEDQLQMEGQSTNGMRVHRVLCLGMLFCVQRDREITAAASQALRPPAWTAWWWCSCHPHGRMPWLSPGLAS